jgi:hypothetical protein
MTMPKVDQAGAQDDQYDVAISFLHQDEPLARTIAERLAPLRVFVYSKSQEEVAGRDGVEAFRDIFRHRCKVAMVLYRRGWGETRWTAVEEIAIRDHCLEKRFEPLMFVRLDEPGDRPKWVPDSYLYLDYKTFGIDDLIGATKAKCASLGIKLEAPTAADKAMRIARGERFAAETEDLKRASLNPFREAQAAVNESLRSSAEALRQGSGWEVAFGFDERETVIRAEGVTVQLLTREVYANSCREGQFLIRVFEGTLTTPEESARGGFATFQPSERSRRSIHLTRTPELGWCWLDGGQVRSSDQIAETVIEALVSARRTRRE